MIGPALLAALKAAGGSELVKYALSAAGATLIQHIEERIGIKVGEAGFDQPAADYALANMQEMNDFRLAMRKADSEDLKTRAEHTQQAREHHQRMNGDDKEILLMIIKKSYRLLYSVLFLALLSFISTILSVKYFPGEIQVTVPLTSLTSMLTMIAGHVMKQLSSQNDFYFGSSLGSKTSGAANEKLMDRLFSNEIDKRELTPQRPVVAGQYRTEPQVYIDEIQAVDIPPELSDERPLR